MSKRADDNDDMEEGMSTSERRRRRRRGGGLRVPSDNVPRQRAVEAAPIARPRGADVPDDPVLPTRLDTTDSDTAVTGEFPPRPSSAGGNGVTIGAGDDFADDGKTREMPAVQLEALGLTLDEHGNVRAAESESVDIDLDDVDEPAAPSTAVPAPVPAAPQHRIETGRAATVALSDDDLEEVDSGRLSRGVSPLPRAGTPGMTQTPPPVISQTPSSEVSPMPVVIVPRRTGASQPPPFTPPATAPRTRGISEPPPPPPAASHGQSPPAMEVGKDASAQVRATATSSDSGEILNEDVLEEVEGRAAAAAAAIPQPIAAANTISGAVHAVAAQASVVPPATTSSAPPSPPPATAAAPAPAPTAAPSSPAAPPPAPPSAAAQRPPPSPPKKSPGVRAAAVAAAAAPDATKKKKKGKPWFEEIFDEDYLRTLPFLTPQATQAEAQFVIDALGVNAGAQVLDLGCGYGRHAMELAARGFHVVGLDLSLPLLLRGADEAQRRELSINFVHGDMRELDFDGQFDGAYCLFSTFGFFDDETNKKTAANLSRALKPGGRVVIDILNRDYMIADLPSRVWWEGDGCVVLEEVEFNYFASRISSNRSVVFDDGRQLEQEISIRAYSLHEVGKLMHAAGFRVLEVSGSMSTKGRFFGNQSRHIIVVAEKRPREPDIKV